MSSRHLYPWDWMYPNQIRKATHVTITNRCLHLSLRTSTAQTTSDNHHFTTPLDSDTRALSTHSSHTTPLPTPPTFTQKHPSISHHFIHTHTSSNHSSLTAPTFTFHTPLHTHLLFTSIGSPSFTTHNRNAQMPPRRRSTRQKPSIL
jgi:hypothetical protein